MANSNITIPPGWVPISDELDLSKFGELAFKNTIEAKIITGLGELAKKDILTASDIPSLDAGKIASGAFVEARIPNLNASKINAGTLGTDRIPSLTTSKITGLDTTLNSKLDTTAANTNFATKTELGTKADTSTVATLQTSVNGKLDTATAKTTLGLKELAYKDSLAASDIPSLDAGKITSGSFGTDRIPSLDAGKVTSGAFVEARIPNLNASKITAGMLGTDRIPSLTTSKITGLDNQLANRVDYDNFSGVVGYLLYDLNEKAYTVDLKTLAYRDTVAAAQIENTAITSAKIADGAVSNAKIAGLAITSDKIGNNAISGAKLIDGSISNAKIASNAAIDISKTTGDIPQARIPNLPTSKITGLDTTLSSKLDTTAANTNFTTKTDFHQEIWFVYESLWERPAWWELGSLAYKNTLVASDIPSLDAGKIISGSFGTDRIPNLDAGKIASGAFVEARIPNLNASKITAGTLGTDRIPNLDAAKVTTGAFVEARIPNLNASKITAGTLGTDRIPNLDAAKIATGTLPLARGGTGGTTQASARTALGLGTLATKDSLVASDIPSLSTSKITGLDSTLTSLSTTLHSVQDPHIASSDVDAGICVGVTKNENMQWRNVVGNMVRNLSDLPIHPKASWMGCGVANGTGWTTHVKCRQFCGFAGSDRLFYWRSTTENTLFATGVNREQLRFIANEDVSLFVKVRTVLTSGGTQHVLSYQQTIQYYGRSRSFAYGTPYGLCGGTTLSNIGLSCTSSSTGVMTISCNLPTTATFLRAEIWVDTIEGEGIQVNGGAAT